MSSSDSVKQRIILENYVWDCRNTDFIISIDNVDCLWFQGFVSFVATKKLFDFLFLGNCISKICLDNLIFDVSDSDFNKYLYLKGIIKESQCKARFKSPKQWRLKNIDYYELPLCNDSIQYYVKDDDLPNFIAKITNNNISISDEILSILDHFYSIPNFACFSGSLNIVKYLHTNNIKFDYKSISMAVCSGSEALIEFLSNHDFSFNNTINNAVQYHQNKIAKWIYNFYSNDHFTLADCIESYNTEMFLFFFNEIGLDPNQPSFVMKNTSLMMSVINNDILIADIIIQKGNCIDLKNGFNKSAFDYSQTEDMKKRIQFAFG